MEDYITKQQELSIEKQQKLSMEDYIESSLMLQYNKGNKWHFKFFKKIFQVHNMQ